MRNLSSTFDHLYEVISTAEFLSMESLGGEIPFFIATYQAIQETEVQKAIKGLINKLENHGTSVLELNLYDICIGILDEELGEGEIFKLEGEMDKDEFKGALQSILDIHEVLMPKIKSIIDDKGAAKVYFLTGIGLVFPFIRSHNILNNLQNIAREAPTVSFFPGDYNGHSLNLFGLLRDDNYYRAFNLADYKIKP